MHNNCGKKRGCEIDYALPHDGELKPISSEVLRNGNDLQEILSAPNLYMAEILLQARQMEAMAA